MATPTVTIVSLPLHSFVACPICSTLIARDAKVWQVHLETNHSGVAGTWADTGIRGNLIGMTGTRLFRDGSRVKYYAPTCYGCGAVFADGVSPAAINVNLLAHLLAVHGAS